MKKNEQQIAGIRNALDQSTQRLNYSVTERLARSRHVALRHASTKLQSNVGKAGHDTLHLKLSAIQHDFRFWISLAIIITCSLAAGSYWQQLNEDHSDIDIAILTDELPIDVYVD
jgi:hypothetical protein